MCAEYLVTIFDILVKTPGSVFEKKDGNLDKSYKRQNLQLVTSTIWAIHNKARTIRTIAGHNLLAKLYSLDHWNIYPEWMEK